MPSCMTAPEPTVAPPPSPPPAPAPPVTIVRAPTPASISQGLSADDNDLETLCSSLLFDDHAALSPLPVDRSSLLESMSHDIDDVIDSVMIGGGDDLPPLADLTSQLTVVPSVEDVAEPLDLPPTPPPVIPVIPPALTFIDGRPSIVVKLRRLPSRAYRANNSHDYSVQRAADVALTACSSSHVNPVVKIEQIPNGVLSSPTLRHAAVEISHRSRKSPVSAVAASTVVPRRDSVKADQVIKSPPVKSPSLNEVRSASANPTSSSLSPRLNDQLKANVSLSPYKGSGRKRKLSGSRSDRVDAVQPDIPSADINANDPNVKRKSQKGGAADNRRLSETSNSGVRRSDGKRKAELPAEPVIDDKRSCNEDPSVVDSKPQTNKKR